MDLHVTDGAQFREDISVEVEPGDGWDLELGRTGHALRDAALTRLQQQGFLSLPYYPSFVVENHPESGFAVAISTARFSTSHPATRNRFGALVDTHSWKNYARRVAATHATVLAMIELAALDIPAGSLFVSIAQPQARLVMSLLEPEAPESYAAWGDFDAAFEQKEHMEDYVTEVVARDMLAKDPALRQQFEQRLREDAAFAADPAARLQLFCRRHPSWDDRAFLYRVYRR